MRILVTGVSGFIGSRLADRLCSDGNDVDALIRPDGRLPNALSGLRLFPADLRDAAAVRSVLLESRPDAVIHCAMTAGHASDSAGRLVSLSSSVMGTAHLAEASAECGVRKFVHLGSFLGYRHQARAIAEDDPFGPTTARGAAKAAASLWLRQFAGETGFPATELRVFSVYGPGEPAHRFIPALLRAARDGSALPLLSGPSHDFVYVDDVVEACLRSLTAKVAPGSAFNIAGGKSWKNEETVAEARAATGRPIAVLDGQYPAKAADADFWLADISKSSTQLGWRPRHSLREGLREAFACLP